MNNEINMCTNFVAFFPLIRSRLDLILLFDSSVVGLPFGTILIGFSMSLVQHLRAAEKYAGKGTNDLWPSSKSVFSSSTNILRRNSITCSDCESLVTLYSQPQLAIHSQNR